MNNTCLPLVIVALLGISTHDAVAQEGRLVRASETQDRIAALATPSTTSDDLYATMWRNAATSVRDWVTEQAANARTSADAATTLDASIRASIATRFAGQGLDAASSTMLVFLVLKNALDESATEYGRQAETWRRIDESSTTVARLAGLLRTAVQQSLAVPPTAPCRSELCTGFSGTAASIRLLRSELGFAPFALDGEIATVGDLRARSSQMDSLVTEMQDRAEKQKLRVESIVARHSELTRFLEASATTSANLRASTLRNLK